MYNGLHVHYTSNFLSGNISKEEFLHLKKYRDRMSKEISNVMYLNKIEKDFGRVSYLSDDERERLDRKIRYPRNGIYLKDKLSILKQELGNLINSKNDKDILRQKMDFIVEHFDKIISDNDSLKYLERNWAYIFILRNLLNKDELDRVKQYNIAINDNLSNPISVIRIFQNNSESESYYYLYSDEQKKFVYYSKPELIKYAEKYKFDKIETVEAYNGRRHMGEEILFE